MPGWWLSCSAKLQELESTLIRRKGIDGRRHGKKLDVEGSERRCMRSLTTPHAVNSPVQQPSSV
jgi:hypothetical protein